MARSMVACDQPPLVRRLTVSDLGDTHATLQWQLSGGRGGYYGLELNYKKMGELPSVQYQLSKWETLAVVRSLEPNTTYLATLFTANQCARTEPMPVTFHTKVTMLHPNVLKVMPHELVLTGVVMLIWMLIVRHFFHMYSHVAMVNPVTYGGYRMGGGTELKNDPSHSSLNMLTPRATPRASLVPSSGSQHAAIGSVYEQRRRSSTLNSRPILRRQYSSSHSLHSHHGQATVDERNALLAGAVEKWRSEAVLARMDCIAKNMPPVRSSVLRTAQSWTDIRQAGSSKKKKRRSSTTSTLAEKNDVVSRVVQIASALQKRSMATVPVVRISIEEEEEEAEEAKENAQGTGAQSETRDRTDSVGSISFRPPAMRSASLNDPFIVSPDRKRKISALLLGKATTDIRRCSSPPHFDSVQMDRLMEMVDTGRKRNRLSFFRSFRRKQKAPPKSQMTMVTEEEDSVHTDEATNCSEPSFNKSLDDHNEYYHTDQLPLLFDRQRSSTKLQQRGKLLPTPSDGYRQDSSDSYVTASEFLSRNNDNTTRV